MDVELQLSSSKLGDDSLDKLTRDLKKTLEQESDIKVTLPTKPSEKGMKGDPITIGLLIMTFISSGAAVALINVLKSYFERDSSLEVAIKKPDGSEVHIGVKNYNKKEIISALEEVGKVS